MPSAADSTLLFYPTSPVHVRDFAKVGGYLPGWRTLGIEYRPLARVAPGISDALAEQGVDAFQVNNEAELDSLPNTRLVLAIGAVFEPFALELLAWAKRRCARVIGIEEVAQLALNANRINNYDAPFDRLFVASPDERRRFLELGYPDEMLEVSGLLANDRIAIRGSYSNRLAQTISVGNGKKPIVYTTSPLRGRLSLHNADDLQFRTAVLAELAAAGRRTRRKIVVKLHPNEAIEPARELVHAIIPDAVVLGRDVHMDELFQLTGILVNRGNSQTCLEAVLRGVPTVVAACGIETLFHADGGAYVIDELDELAAAIERADAEGAPDGARIRANHYFLPPQGVACLIAEDILCSPRVSSPPAEDTWNWLIKSMLFLGCHDRALALCKTLNPRSPWQTLVHDALLANSEGRTGDAIQMWRQCTAIDPGWYFSAYELAHGFAAIGEYRKALEHAERAIALHPPFHALWHEIPMRVVRMVSIRNAANHQGASEELKVLERRGLVESMPELLIEKAAQLSCQDEKLVEAESLLITAIRQLDECPVNDANDDDLRDRALCGYLRILIKKPSANSSDRLLEDFERIVHAAESSGPGNSRVYSISCRVAEEFEKQSQNVFAGRCYELAIKVDGTNPTALYGRAKLKLKQKQPVVALRMLHRVSTIADGPKTIVQRIISHTGAARLGQYWPSSPRSIVQPIILLVLVMLWCIKKSWQSPRRGIYDAIGISVVIWFFVGRHFKQRVRGEWDGARRATLE